MKYKKYPSYKDSGVEWLEKVPENWDIVRNKVAFQFVKSLVGEDSKNYNLLSLTLRGIILRDIESGKGKFPAEFNTYQKVEKDDLIFCLFDIDETPRTIGISKHDGMITGAYNVARCNQKMADAKFMYYYYLSVDEYKGLNPFYTGLRKVVRTETFMNIELGLPSLNEQQQIAKFLDNATQKMDTLIQKQENLIKLLKEKRQAVISHAVTRGLNPDVKFKDSGVEWLGDVPEHWGIHKLKYSVKKIGDIDHDMPKSISSGKPYLMTGDIIEKASLINFSDTKQISEVDYLRLSRKIKPNKGDIIFARYATIGTVCYVDIEKDFLVSYSCVTIKTIPEKVFGEYLVYFFKSNFFFNEIRNYINSNTQGNIGIDSLYRSILILPDLDDQRQILKYLNDKTKKIDTLIEKSKQSIKLLKEKRTALISAAVTGKIDVREAL